MFTVNWHEIMQDIDDNARTNAIVICNRGDSACVYYSNKYGFDTYRAENWKDIKATSPSEVWWVQTNLIREIKHESQEKKIIASVSEEFSESEVQHYAPQDPAIRSFKSKFLNAREYEYRVDVFRFYNP